MGRLREPMREQPRPVAKRLAPSRTLLRGDVQSARLATEGQRYGRDRRCSPKTRAPEIETRQSGLPDVGQGSSRTRGARRARSAAGHEQSSLKIESVGCRRRSDALPRSRVRWHPHATSHQTRDLAKPRPSRRLDGRAVGEAERKEGVGARARSFRPARARPRETAGAEHEARRSERWPLRLDGVPLGIASVAEGTASGTFGSVETMRS